MRTIDTDVYMRIRTAVDLGCWRSDLRPLPSVAACSTAVSAVLSVSFSLDSSLSCTFFSEASRILTVSLSFFLPFFVFVVPFLYRAKDRRYSIHSSTPPCSSVPLPLLPFFIVLLSFSSLFPSVCVSSVFNTSRKSGVRFASSSLCDPRLDGVRLFAFKSRSLSAHHGCLGYSRELSSSRRSRSDSRAQVDQECF